MMQAIRVRARVRWTVVGDDAGADEIRTILVLRNLGLPSMTKPGTLDYPAHRLRHWRLLRGRNERRDSVASARCSDYRHHA